MIYVTLNIQQRISVYEHVSANDITHYLKKWGIIPAIFRHVSLACILLLIFVHPPLELPVKIKKNNKKKKTNKQTNKKTKQNTSFMVVYD